MKFKKVVGYFAITYFDINGIEGYFPLTHYSCDNRPLRFYSSREKAIAAQQSNPSSTLRKDISVFSMKVFKNQIVE